MDRQDIDALLIGALYGELTPADEARLTAHLDSHPTDRGALDDLKSARQAVRESRIFELQADPPQAVSALLLQEAHRRAPKRAPEREEKEGWFYRFSRMFLAHPAMAAAAMLVLVVGVAGTLYMKKGSDHFADKRVEAPMAESAVATPTAQDPAAAKEAPANEAVAEGAVAGDNGIAQGSGAGSSFGYQVQLADGKADNAETRDRADKVARLKDQQNALERQQELAKNKKATSNAIIVDTPRREPKELEEPRAKTATVSGAKKGKVSGGEDEIATDGFDSNAGLATGSTASHAGAGGGGAVGGATGTGAPSGRVATTPPAAGPARNAPGQAAAPSPPPPPPSPAPATVAQTQPKAPAAKPTAPAKVTKEAEKSEAKPDATASKDATLLAWAKGQHSQAQSLAGKGDCAAAAKVAVLISNRAPDYYSQNVATDRALKKCQAYIAAERDADAERSGKARAQKRVNADQPAEATH